MFGQATRNHQPTRLDGFLRPAASVHENEDSTSDQIAQGGVWKVEWNASSRERSTSRCWGDSSSPAVTIGRTAPRPELKTPNLRSVRRQPRLGTDQRDDQIVASASFATAGWAGSHHVKVGGEFRRRTLTERWHQGYAGEVLHVTRNLIPNEVYLFQTPSKSVDGMQWYGAYLHDVWRIASRLTLNLGLRFDRYRVFFPAQEHPAGQSGSRSWTAQTFAAVENMIDWNVVVPRVSVSHDLAGNGRTVLKLSYGTYSMPPGQLRNANPNSREWWERFDWVDENGDRLWDPGENIRSLERTGGEGIESIDPGLKLGFMREATARIEREIAPDMAVETGVVWRGVREPFLRQDETQPFSAFTRAVTVTDRGIDQVAGG